MDAVAIAWIVAAVPLVGYIWMTWGLLFLRLEVDMNDPGVAARAFTELLDDAAHTMWICDDGNDMPDSLYNMDHIVEAVKRKLNENENLRLLCLFSCADETKFSAAFADEPRVIMKTQQPRRSVHFKIIDDAAKGYVSSHSYESTERRYRKYDCRHFFVFDHIREAALGRHVRGVRNLFPEVAVA